MKNKKFFIVGGAGFMGSHFTDRLLSHPEVEAVTLFDNFSSGREWHHQHHLKDQRLKVIRGDVKNLTALKNAMAHHEVVIHLASNPDIALAATVPDIDFREGTCLTSNVVEAMRMTGANRILYASGSGVYGDLGEIEAHENSAPLIPISTYGASKSAGEGLISSYCYMFGITACCFRFGNVVGPRQTHGVGFDFARRLLKDPNTLKILGDGNQSKSYIHVFDVVNAVLMAHEKTKEAFQVYNVATGDYITVTEIARLAIDCCGISAEQIQLAYTGGPRGWKGDIPVVRLNTDRIKKLGWTCKKNSREALQASLQSMIQDIQAGKMGQTP